MWFRADLNYNFECDWRIELSDNKLTNNKEDKNSLVSELRRTVTLAWCSKCECSETVFVVTWDTQYWDVLSTNALHSDLRLLSGYLKKNKSGVILKAEEE